MCKYKITIFEKDSGKPIYTETISTKNYNEAIRIAVAHCIAKTSISYADFGTKYYMKL